MKTQQQQNKKQLQNAAVIKATHLSYALKVLSMNRTMNKLLEFFDGAFAK